MALAYPILSCSICFKILSSVQCRYPTTPRWSWSSARWQMPDINIDVCQSRADNQSENAPSAKVAANLNIVGCSESKAIASCDLSNKAPWAFSMRNNLYTRSSSGPDWPDLTASWYLRQSPAFATNPPIRSWIVTRLAARLMHCQMTMILVHSKIINDGCIMLNESEGLSTKDVTSILFYGGLMSRFTSRAATAESSAWLAGTCVCVCGPEIGLTSQLKTEWK